ncbi:myosin-2 heavy chain-like [Rhopilema esculentum]|uniref:myosin-2 heavy chain-like n=1 Tax=Rhopilema esculentum TaxID=499914 RepID=UPI0031D2F5C3
MSVVNSEAADISKLVLSTVDHLQDLAKRIKQWQQDQDSFDDISGVVEIIINTLHELDSDRLQVHQELEAETIKASIQRHKLAPYAEEIENEIRAAVTFARESNESEINKLQDKIDGILNEKESSEQRLSLLTVESCSLEPEKDELTSQHERMVAVLNQTLTDRANMQIKLNETRDHLRETYRKISDVEKALIDIEVEMEEDKEEARINKDKLQKSVKETKKKVEEQATANLIKSKEIKKIQSELNDQELELDEKKKAIRQLETSKTRLEANQVQLTRQVRKEVKENARLTQEGMKILETGAGSSQKLIESQEELNETKKAVESEMAKSNEEFQRLSNEKMKLSNELEAAKSRGTKEKDEADLMQKRLRSAKDELLTQSDDCQRLKRANTELESTIDQLLQDHQAIVELLNKQISDFTFNLAAERKERQLLQTKRDEITKEINEFKTDYGKLMSGITKKINDGKSEHHKLTDLGIMLQKSLKQDEVDISNKQKQLKRAKEQHAKIKQSLKAQISKLEKSIASIEKEIQEKSDLIKERTPPFEDLKKLSERKTTEFEEMKKYIVDLKNKKSGLESSVSTTSQKILTMQNPQKSIQKEIIENRKKNLELLRLQTDELKKKEQEIFLAEHRLGLINQENQRMSKVSECYV